MKFIKKIAAVLLVAVMVLSICGCHKKDEIAVTIGDNEFTSAYYMCALINAYQDGQAEVYETLTEEEQQSTDIDYFSKKIDDKSFNNWVKDRAIEILKTVSYYKSACEKAKVEIDADTRTASEYYASTIWQSYSQLFESNGVSQATFTKFFVDGAPSQITDYALYYMFGMGTPNDYEELYFQHLYGKDGEKEIAAKTVKKELYNNYIIADVLEVTFTEEQKDAERKKIKEQFEEYEKDLKNGKTTFAKVYKEYNKITDDNNLPQSDAKDPYASILDITSHNYTDIKKMDTDEVKLFYDKEEGHLQLVVKKDIESDKYYLETLDTTLRHSLKDEEYLKASEKEIAKLKAEINDFAVDRFKVKDIVIPESQY
ncbi:MAG: hypothetical protein IJD45_02725 [Clostridia bacterium]|nr:hypothetical protein [Clostridia bacterium]